MQDNTWWIIFGFVFMAVWISGQSKEIKALKEKLERRLDWIDSRLENLEPGDARGGGDQ